MQLSKSPSVLYEMHWNITYSAHSCLWGVLYAPFVLPTWYCFHRIDIKLTNNLCLHLFPCRYHLKQMKFVKAPWVKMKLTCNWATVNINLSFDNYILLLCVMLIVLCGLQECSLIYYRDILITGLANYLNLNFN